MTLTKEWLLTTISELEEERDATPGAVNEDAAMALAAMKLALASLEAEKEYKHHSVISEQLAHVLSSMDATDHQRAVISCAVDRLNSVSQLLQSSPSALLVPEMLDYQGAKELYNYLMTEEETNATVNGWNACRAAMLQGAEPVTTAYKLRDAVEIIRSSGIEIDAEKIFAERDALNAPDCWCRTCRPITLTDMRFVVCPVCGNKRCPHANDHRNACTGSNEPDQEGSAYPAAPQQEAE
ncbi:hypothetical protein DP185_16410 [Enterobacter hormaechei]|uniref:hypothetical protein n=1 Tax=Enterobacter quasihormaechei TaxID=2529382 RepID=UPI000DCD3321|nr:hypothetical protein DP185_16410 [Enterobacter hormaechei]